MRHFLFLLFLFCLCRVVLAQQNSIREVDKFSDLRNHVQDVSRTRFVKGYNTPGDGASGFFVFTNTIVTTNLGTRIQVTGKPYSWERVHDGTVNIRWFGAQGIAGDDTAAIQAALDYCHSNNFTTFIPGGNFGVVSTLVVKDNAKIVGQGKRSVLFGLATTRTMTISSRTNILLRDFQFAGTSENQLYVNGATAVVVENVETSGATLDLGSLNAGIHWEACSDLTFINPVFSRNGLGNNASAFAFNMVGGFFGLNSTNVTVINPTIRDNNAAYGIAFYHQKDAWVRGGNVDMNFIGSTNNFSGYGLLTYGTFAEPNSNINFQGVNVKNTYGSGIYFNLTIGGSAISPKLETVAQSQSDFSAAVGGIAVNFSSKILLESVSITDSGINSGVVFSTTTNCSLIGGTIDGVGTNKFAVLFGGRTVGAKVKGLSMYSSLPVRRAIGMPAGNFLISSDIEGNRIDGFYDGIILLAGSSNNIVRGNTINADVNTGIQDFGSFNTIEHNNLTGGGVGIYAAGDNGLIGLNTVQGHTTGLLLLGSSYRIDPLGRYNDNAIPISDAGGSIIKTLTAGTTPSVKDSAIYFLSYASPVTITTFADGLIGERRTFFASNTNSTIQHGASIILDGAGDFNMKAGDTLTLELDPSGAWRQVGKSMDINWLWYDRAAEQIHINSPVYLANYLQQLTSPSTSIYPDDHIVNSTNLVGALIARWIATGNQNAFSIRTTTDGAHYVLNADGVDYVPPATNGISGKVLATDGGTPQHLYWTNIGGGSSYTFDPTQLGVSGGNVWITNGALTTNIVLKGAVTAPILNVSGINIDAATGTEFSKILASNTTLGIQNMADGQVVNFTVTNTTFTLTFTNAITWISGITPVLDTNAVNVFHFFKTGGRILGSDPEQRANVNLVALAGMTGTGVVVKTNATSFTTFTPLPIIYGGTGTNSFASGSSVGNIPFHTPANAALDIDDGQFTYNKSSGVLNLVRNLPTGLPQMLIVEASGVVPILSVGANRIQQANDSLYLEEFSLAGNIYGQIFGSTGFKLSKDLSFIAGGGSTSTTRTNQFLYIPTSTGVPTGIPAVETGFAAMEYNTSAKHLYVYQAGWNQIDGGSGTSFSGVVNGVVYSPDGSTITNGSNIVITGTGTQLQLNGTGLYPLLIADSGNADVTDLKGGEILFNPSGSTDQAITIQQQGNQHGLKFRIGAEDPMIKLSTNRNVLLGMSASTNVARTTNFVYLETTTGAPTGVPVADGGVAITYDTVNNRLMAYNAGWQNISGGGGTSDNWQPVAGNTTNSFLVGDWFANQGTLTNGLKLGAALIIAPTLSMLNAGLAVTLQNNSLSRLSHLDLKGGLGAETYIQFYASNTVAGSFDTNRLFNAFYGIKSDNGMFTNSLNVPNSAAPSTTVFGQIAADNNAWAASRGAFQAFDGTANTFLVGALASDVPGNGQVPTWNTGGTITWETPAAIAAAVWTNDNQIVKFDPSTGMTNKLWIADGQRYVVRIDTAVPWPQAPFDRILEINNDGSNVFTVSALGGVVIGQNSALFWGSQAENGESLVSIRNCAPAGPSVQDPPFNQIYIGTTNLGNMGFFDLETRTNDVFLTLGVNTIQTTLNPSVINGASAVAYKFDTLNPLFTSGAKLLAVANNGTNKMWLDLDGKLHVNTIAGPPASVTRLNVESGKPPQSNPARLSNVSDYVWETLFDASTSQSTAWSFIMPQDYGTSLKVRFKTTVKSVQTGTKSVIYRFYVAAMKATEDPTNPTFSSANSVTVTLANNQAANQIVESTVNLTNNDSVVAGDLVILKLDRDAVNGSDDATGDSAIPGSIAVEWLKQ